MDFDPHLTIESLSSINKPDLSLKLIHLEHSNKKIKTPFKVLTGERIDTAVFSSIENDVKIPFIENNRFLFRYKSLKRLDHLLREAGSFERVSGLNNLFNIREALWKKPLTSLSLVFDRDPFIENKYPQKNGIFPLKFDWDNYSVLLDYIHDRSSGVILTPDFRIKKGPIPIDTYIEYIIDSIEHLSNRNNRPVFAPIQIELDAPNLRKVISTYSKLGITNLWVNFLAHPCDTAYGGDNGILRTIRNSIDSIFPRGTKIALYYSHIKKEISPNLRDSFVPASDILTMFNGADFIGANRDPDKAFQPKDGMSLEEIKKQAAENYKFNSVEEYEMAVKYHKSRVFNPSTYYYYTLNNYPDNLLFTPAALLNYGSLNRFVNSYYLYSEIERTRKKMEDLREDEIKIKILEDAKMREKAIKDLKIKKKTFVDYFKTKKMIKENDAIRNMVVPDQSRLESIDKDQDPISLLNKL